MALEYCTPTPTPTFGPKKKATSPPTLTPVPDDDCALDTALLNVNYFYERDVRESIDKALKLLEPAMTLVLGGILALILFSVLTPIYDILGNIKF